MATDGVTRSRVKATKPLSTTKSKRLSVDRFREPSTWGGIFAVAAAFATGGASVLADPVLLGQVAAGVGMILNQEG